MQPHSPFLQSSHVVPCRPLRRKTGHAPPTRLSILLGPIVCPDGIAHHFLSGGRCREFGFGSEAADDGDFGDWTSGRGGEGAESGAEGDALEGAHCGEHGGFVGDGGLY